MRVQSSQPQRAGSSCLFGVGSSAGILGSHVVLDDGRPRKQAARFQDLLQQPSHFTGRANAGYAHVTTTSHSPLVSMATTLSSPLSDPGGCLICQRLALAVVLVDLGNTSKEISRCFSITARFAGSHRSLRPDTARLPVQSVPVTIRQGTFSTPGVYYW